MLNTRRTKLLTVIAASAALGGCLDSGGRTGKNANPVYEISNPNRVAEGTRPLFDPLNTVFPLPSDPLFFLNKEMDGTMLNGTDPANPVTTGLGFVDGNSVLAPFDIKISDSLDPNQALDARSFIEVDGEVVPNPDQNIFVLEMDLPSGDSVYPLEGEAAGIVEADLYRYAKRLQAQGDNEAAQAIFDSLLEERFRVELITVDADGPAGEPGGVQNNAIRLLPLRPLKPKTKYAVALSNKILDKNGDPLVQENRFESVSNPSFVLSNPALQPFRNSMLPARAWATQFFGFKQEQSGAASEALGFDDIVFAISFTTTAVEDVLLANAAPAAWFRQHLLVERKQAVIKQLLDGELNLTGQPLSGASTETQQVNDRIFELLTDPQYPLYNEELADILASAEQSGMALAYGDLVRSVEDDRQLAYTLQASAGSAVEDVVDVAARAAELAASASELLDVPSNPADTSKVRFFSQKEGGEVNPALEQVALDLLLTEVTVSPSVYEGEISLPYYQPIPDGDGTVLQTGSWQPADFSSNTELPQAKSDRISYRFPFAQKQGDVKVPIVVVGPDPSFVGAPTEGYPVIIYQHAATQDRSAILPMATAAGLLCLADSDLANADAPLTNGDDCFVTVGIDLPLNGVFGEAAASSGGGMVEISQQDGASPDATERHFGFTAGPNMQPASAAEVENPESGSLFLNFTNFANTRDNMRQGALDLLHVNALLPAIEQAINDCSQCTDELSINENRVYFISHSLSGMGGVPFPVINNLAAEDNDALRPVLASVLFNTGGQFSRLAENSRDTIAPVLLPTLNAASDGLLAQGRTELNIYFNVFQALLDSTDPVAFAPLYEQTGNSATLLTSIVGIEGDPDRPSDGTVPNAADAQLYDAGALELTLPNGFQIDSEPAPLAGTDPLARYMGAVAIDSTGDDGSRPIITRYLEGSHGNPVSAGQKGADPFSSSAVFDEMAAQLVALFRSRTTAETPFSVDVTNACVVEGVGGQPGDAECAEQTDGGRDPDESTGGETGDDGGSGDLLDNELTDLFGGLLGGLTGGLDSGAAQ